MPLQVCREAVEASLLAILLLVAGLVPSVVPAARQATVQAKPSELGAGLEGAASSTVVALRTPSVSAIGPSAQPPSVTFHSTRLCT